MVDIEANLKRFMGTREPTLRYTSFDYCFNYFQSHRDDHRNLTGRINARYGEAVKVWADRIVEYVGRRDEQTGELAKYLDHLARKGIDAERLLHLAAARKPLPVDHPTAALGYRVKDLVTPRRQRRPVPSIDPFPRSPQRDSGPTLGM